MNFKNNRILKYLVIIVLVASAYPAFVLGYTWTNVANSEFLGGKHGPKDAYRHALASAVVSYTIGEQAVELFTALSEWRGSPSNQMDIHNNRVGARIGADADTFSELKFIVQKAVSEGSESIVDEARITWLTEDKWAKGLFW